MRLDPRGVLAIPTLYRAFANLVAGPDARPRVVNEHFRIRPGDAVLDVGCGPGNMLPLMPAGVTYTGIDIAAEYIAAAEAEHGAQGRFLVRPVTDHTSFQDLGRFDVVMAMALLHHLSDSETSSLFSAARAVLKPSGRLVTLDNVYVPEQSALARWIISMDRGLHVRSTEGYAGIARQHFGRVDITILHDLIRIPYTHIIMDCAP